MIIVSLLQNILWIQDHRIHWLFPFHICPNIQWLKWVGTRGNAVPPKAFSVPSKKNSVPAKAISVPAKKTIAFPPKDFAFPPRKCLTTPPLEIGPENSFNYPPSNSQNFIDYPPPSKSGRKTPSTTPPLEFTELHRLPPPLEIGPENSFNYPPSNSRNFIDYLFRLRSWWNALERCLESVPTVKNSHFNHCEYLLVNKQSPSLVHNSRTYNRIYDTRNAPSLPMSVPNFKHTNS